MNRILAIFALVGVLALGALTYADAASSVDKRLFDRGRLEARMDVAAITTTAADFTSWQPLITIAPEEHHALQDVKVAIDLAKATTGFAATYTDETISFAIARKVDGTNWRTADNTKTTAISGTNSAGGGIELDLGTVTSEEGVRVMVKLSAEGNSNASLPFLVHYRAGVRATITPAE